MDEKQRQSQLDKLRQEQAANEDAFDQIAIAIARADVPISKDPAGMPTPQEQAATPADWINNYAEGMARAGKCSQEEAAQGIRSAFENRYGMSPEAYAEQFTPQKQDNSSALDDDLPKSLVKEARKALSAADKALDDLALKGTTPLPPYAEEAHDYILEAQGNPVEYVEMFSGSNREYSWLAKVTRDPTPLGLDGGRVRFFGLVQTGAPLPQAPDLSAPEKHQQWLKDLPLSDIRIAHYDSGKLTREVDGPETDALIAEIKQTCAVWKIDRAADSRLPSVHEALSKAENAFTRLELEEPLPRKAKRARDRCEAVLAKIEQNRDNSHGLQGTTDTGKPSAAAKDDAIARAIEKVKDKVEDEQQRGQHDQGRGRG